MNPPDPRLARIGRTLFWAVPPVMLVVTVIAVMRGDAWAAWTSASVVVLWPIHARWPNRLNGE